jgi:hypothetical protein
MKLQLRPPPCRERGAATLVVILALLGAMALAVLFINRGLLLETRMSANQARSTVAFEAAEAGVDWALAQLNAAERIGTDCRADAAAALSFRERYLASGLRPACTRSGSGWTCSCPTSGTAALPTPTGDDDAPAFSVAFGPGPRADIATLVSTGTTNGGAAQARITVSIALVPALASAPAAPLTARGDIAVGATPIAVHDLDPASPGVGLHAGGSVDASAVAFNGPGGATSVGRIAGLDAPLAALDGEHLFVALFGLPKAAWRDQPMTRRLRCAVDCSAELATTIGSEVTAPMVWIDGDAVLDGPVTYGRADRPVVIVVEGRLQLRGAVTLHGVAYANGIVWTGSGGSPEVRGALVSESGYSGDAAVTLHRETAVFAALRRTGSYVKVPGSWRDF